MSARVAARLAWAAAGASVVLQLGGLVLALVSGEGAPVFDVFSIAVMVAISVVGALVATREPGNPIGWLLGASGLLLAAAGATYGYAALALGGGRSLPGGVAAAWLTSFVFLPAIFAVPALVFLLFPSGRPLTRRWRPVVLAGVVAGTCQSLGGALRPGPMVDVPVKGVTNPVGGPAWLASSLEMVGWSVGLLCIGLGGVALVLRYRRSTGVERLQVRWVAFAAVLFVLACAISAVLFQTRYALAGQALVQVGFGAIPVAAGIAILRHRLYDIDIVVNRALVYGGLTAALLVCYLTSVLVLRLVLSPLTGESDLAVAASTLAVAALFRPARAHIQSAVDRRFYRRRYDAARALDAFTGRLRHEVDLEAVQSDLLRAVRDTVAPTHSSLWLRP